MRKPENQKNQVLSTSKSYQKSPENARSKAGKRTAELRKVRRENALCRIAIGKLAQLLGLGIGAEVHCPICNAPGLVLDAHNFSFHCNHCKKKGTSIRLVKEVKKLSDWKAIAFIENISLESSEPPAQIQPTIPPKPNKYVSPEQIEKIKREVSILSLAQRQGIVMRHSGKSYLGLCPFHRDTSPSLAIDDKLNLWKCHGACNAGGSVIDWVMRRSNVDFREAVEILQREIPSLTPFISKPKPIEVPEVSESYREKIINWAVDYYHASLKKSPQALEYLKKRGIASPETIGHFRIGYGDRTLGLKLPAKSQAEGRKLRHVLTESGILRPSGHERFTGSITFPIYQGKNLGEIYARRIGPSAKGARHLYLPGSHQGIFHPEAFNHKEVILCESIIDAITFYEAGLKNVTASFGSCGPNQEMLEKFKNSPVERVYIAYDSDDSGDKGAIKTAHLLENIGLSSCRLNLPRGMDINDFARKHQPARETLPRLLEGARQTTPSFFSFAVKKETVKEKKSERPQPKPGSGYVRRKGTDLEFAREDRIYLLRGLKKNFQSDKLRITLRAMRGKRIYIDSFNIYDARRRLPFAEYAAKELGVEVEKVRSDMTDLLLELEILQEQEKNQAEENDTPKMNENERQAAETYLRAPGLIDRIQKDLESCGLVGEKENALIEYLAMTSRLMDEPLALIVQSFSAAGKTTLMNYVLDFMPPEDVIKYSAMSGQSLFYLGETSLKHKILAISEEEGAERASYSLKLLQSESELRMASAGKDGRSGKFITHEYRVEGPTMIILATTSVEIDEEFANRCLFISANEGIAQTLAIQARQRHKQTLEGMIRSKTHKIIKKQHQNIQRLLKPIVVVNPYAENLTFLSSRVRYRRDQPKYLTLINAIALLHQYQRPKKHHRLPNGEVIEYIEVSVSDIILANKLFTKAVGISLDELPPQTRKLLTQIHKMVKEQCQKQEIEQKQYLFTRKDVRNYTHWSDSQLKIHLDRLVDMEYLITKSGGNGRRYTYQMLYRGEGQDGSLFTLGLIDPSTLYNHKYDCDLSG